MYVQGVTSEDNAQVLKHAGKHHTLCSLLNDSTTATTVMSKIFTVACSVLSLKSRAFVHSKYNLIKEKQN